MIMNGIDNTRNKSSTLELSALNNASDQFLFITELLSVLLVCCATFNNHVLIVYYDSKFTKYLSYNKFVFICSNALCG